MTDSAVKVDNSAVTPKEKQPPEGIQWRTLRTWSMTLETFGHVKFECVSPLSPVEVEDVLAWLDIIRRQVSQFAREVRDVQP